MAVNMYCTVPGPRYGHTENRFARSSFLCYSLLLYPLQIYFNPLSLSPSHHSNTLTLNHTPTTFVRKTTNKWQNMSKSTNHNFFFLYMIWYYLNIFFNKNNKSYFSSSASSLESMLASSSARARLSLAAFSISDLNSTKPVLWQWCARYTRYANSLQLGICRITLSTVFKTNSVWNH